MWRKSARFQNLNFATLIETMPFTLTHTLAVLPLTHRQSPLPITALLIGAMVPDWSLFVPFGPHYITTHTVTGLLTACLPLGFVLFIVFNALYRRALIELMPVSIQARMDRYKYWQSHFSATQLVYAAAAVLIGAASHLLWDAFTHSGRWGVELIPVLNQTLFVVAGTDVQGYKFFQHGSSVVGLPLLAYMAWQWLQRQPLVDPRPTLLSRNARVTLCTLLLLLPALAAASKIWPMLDNPLTTHWLHRALFYSVTQFGLWLLVFLTAYSVVLRAMSSERMRLDVYPGLPG